MAKSIKGTQTEKNLMISFAGESQARNRYTYFASVAKKEGLVQISHIFKKRPLRKKNTPNAFSSLWKAAKLKLPKPFLLAPSAILWKI